MVALSVTGRFIPFFKPVTALTVLTAVYLGGEAGFLCGALSAVISNFWFGQGPWTPFQMLAWGMIGLFAGLLASPLKRSRIRLSSTACCPHHFFIMTSDGGMVNGRVQSELYLSALARQRRIRCYAGVQT